MVLFSLEKLNEIIQSIKFIEKINYLKLKLQLQGWDSSLGSTGIYEVFFCHIYQTAVKELNVYEF